ncbi:hypothetical protein [Rufibacter sp. XAAS-G3-1]|uniref:hypothetical protein n=1 Tax=Rufibacter sp. XAAS-G3-1 TaxID=2729134 RepID=UPI0015E7A692|nr:hypothetical protein [Rufibacter sp. XAAS-G3-1]
MAASPKAETYHVKEGKKAPAEFSGRACIYGKGISGEFYQKEPKNETHGLFS